MLCTPRRLVLEINNTPLSTCLRLQGIFLPQPPGFALPLQKAEDVAFPHWPLDVADDGPVGVVDELHAHLRHVTGVAGAAEDALHFSELDGLVPVTRWRGGHTRGGKSEEVPGSTARAEVGWEARKEGRPAFSLVFRPRGGCRDKREGAGAPQFTRTL